MTHRRLALILNFLGLLLWGNPSWTQTEQQKIENAKKEGSVYWYGSMNVDDASALIAGINKRYPFLDVKRFRAANAPVLSKLDVEARARGLNVDVIDLDGFYVSQVLKRNYWVRYVSPELQAIPKSSATEADFGRDSFCCLRSPSIIPTWCRPPLHRKITTISSTADGRTG
jgi:hypothetical protein